VISRVSRVTAARRRKKFDADSIEIHHPMSFDRKSLWMMWLMFVASNERDELLRLLIRALDSSSDPLTLRCQQPGRGEEGNVESALDEHAKISRRE